MLGLKIEAAKLGFFDRKTVQGKLDRETRKQLSRFGAFVRQRARSSLRRRKVISDPGSPPSSHTDDVKRNIFFVYEAERQGVIIGPAKLNKGEPGALERLEHGGTVARRTKG